MYTDFWEHRERSNEREDYLTEWGQYSILHCHTAGVFWDLEDEVLFETELTDQGSCDLWKAGQRRWEESQRAAQWRPCSSTEGLACFHSRSSWSMHSPHPSHSLSRMRKETMSRTCLSPEHCSMGAGKTHHVHAHHCSHSLSQDPGLVSCHAVPWFSPRQPRWPSVTYSLHHRWSCHRAFVHAATLPWHVLPSPHLLWPFPLPSEPNSNIASLNMPSQ